MLRFPLRAHAEWLALLREALYGHGDLDVEMAADDGTCDLGRWLKQQEAALGGLQEYRDLAAVHTRFHRRAAYCLALAERGRRSDALAELEGSGRLRSLSGQLVGNLQKLRTAVLSAGESAMPAN